jgi:hypothetical protein
VQNRLSYSVPCDLPTAQACAERGVAYLAHFVSHAYIVPHATDKTRRLRYGATALRRGPSTRCG